MAGNFFVAESRLRFFKRTAGFRNSLGFRGVFGFFRCYTIVTIKLLSLLTSSKGGYIIQVNAVFQRPGITLAKEEPAEEMKACGPAEGLL